jgi:hypothetical protein
MYYPLQVLHPRCDRPASPSRSIGGRTEFFCSGCHRQMSPLSPGCGCGGGAVPCEGITSLDPPRRIGRLRALQAAVAALFTRGV